MASYQDPGAGDVPNVGRVGMITNMHNQSTRRFTPPRIEPAQLQHWKEHILVEISQPLVEYERTGMKPAESNGRLEQLDGDAHGLEPVVKQVGETLHALLPIRFVIAQQQYLHRED